MFVTKPPIFDIACVCIAGLHGGEDADSGSATDRCVRGVVSGRVPGRRRRFGRLFPRPRVERRQWRRRTPAAAAGDSDAQTGAARGRRLPVRVRGRQRSSARRIDPARRQPHRRVLVHGPGRQGDLGQVHGRQRRVPHNTGRSRAKSAGLGGATPAAAGARRRRAL